MRIVQQFSDDAVKKIRKVLFDIHYYIILRLINLSSKSLFKA